MPSHLKFILTEMCNRVGAVYENIDFRAEDWYTQYQWTPEEEENYIQWLTQELQTNKPIRKAFRLPSRSHEYVEKNARFFVGVYGWKTKHNG